MILSTDDFATLKPAPAVQLLSQVTVHLVFLEVSLVPWSGVSLYGGARLSLFQPGYAAFGKILGPSSRLFARFPSGSSLTCGGQPPFNSVQARACFHSSDGGYFKPL